MILAVCSARCFCAAGGGYVGLAASSLEGCGASLGLRGVGLEMKSIARSLVIVLLALIAVPALACRSR